MNTKQDIFVKVQALHRLERWLRSQTCHTTFSVSCLICQPCPVPAYMFQHHIDGVTCLDSCGIDVLLVRVKPLVKARQLKRVDESDAGLTSQPVISYK